ncbi:VapE domain-containing protein [Cognatishimia activa]|nr:VapE domain-containing protein [Cognatishimia activa]
MPDPLKAVEFANWLNPSAPLYLERMNSQGSAYPKHELFKGNDGVSAIRFVQSFNDDLQRNNIYFVSNAEFLDGKRSKENISAVRFLHVDLDSKDYPGTEVEQEDRILSMLLDEPKRPRGVPHPTAIWFTGGGFQAVWRLNEPMEPYQAEDLNYSLLLAFQGGAGTHDVSRLLRLPWTTNWLNDKKRADGRVPKLAHPLHPVNLKESPVSFSDDEFKMRRVKHISQQNTAALEATKSLPEFDKIPLPDDINSIIPPDHKWAEVIMTGNNPDGGNYQSRSELVIAATIWMLGNDVAPGHVLAILTDPAFGISAHVLENSNPEKYGYRQIERAYALLELQREGWPVKSDQGSPISNAPDNIRFAFVQYGIAARRNLFNQTDEVTGYQLDGRDLNDIVEILCSTFAREKGFTATPAAIRRELLSLAHENKYHPVINYFNELVWDGTPRIDDWLVRYCGAENSELNREFGSKFFIAGVRRIKQPGVKFDTMLVFEGAQGAGKSQIAALLAVQSEWFCASLDLRSDDKTKAELLSRAWIVECQEMDGLNMTTSQNLKKFLSTSADAYRPAYARNAVSFKRHCVIIGTTNEESYLRDLTGNRRIWPVRLGEIDLAGFASDVDQLWAEAVVREQKGESISLSEHLWDSAGVLQNKRMVEDQIAEVLSDHFAERTGSVSMDSIKLLLNLPTAKVSSNIASRIHAAMTALGWQAQSFRLHDLSGADKRTRNGFTNGDSAEKKSEIRAIRLPSGVVILEQPIGSYQQGQITPQDIPF